MAIYHGPCDQWRLAKLAVTATVTFMSCSPEAPGVVAKQDVIVVIRVPTTAPVHRWVGRWVDMG